MSLPYSEFVVRRWDVNELAHRFMEPGTGLVLFDAGFCTLQSKDSWRQGSQWHVITALEQILALV